MKKALAILLAISVLGTAAADIHTPPGDRETPVRKLSRGLANILYGFMEIPASWEKTLKEEGAPEAFTYGIINGFDRAGMRFGYGLFEVINFRTPKYKDSYRMPYKGLDYDSVHGMREFPPEIGFATRSGYVRNSSNTN